ncbi:MAG: tetratricopeptide repeat protein [Verrucomicrobia bacterium]|nr:tetratricopeptide repeat protein [Verrucomicrobiota bacterium]
MNTYVFDSARPYGAYLQTESAGASPKAELSMRWSMLIGVPLGGGALTPPVSPAAPLAGGAQPPASPFRPAGSPPFHWGNSAQLLLTGQFTRSLAELKHAAKTSAEMWAAEQFDIARDAFRRGLYQEALDYLRRAMEGHEGHDGYALEYRAHFLRGLILLGGFQHHDSSVLDLTGAEHAFATAGRYAVCDQRTDAAWAMLAAGWAAYCQGQMGRALTHTQQALVLQPNLGEAHFQVAKIFLHNRQPDLAMPYLANAVELDPAFARQAALDGDFVPFAQETFAVVEARRHQVGQRASRALQDVIQRAKECGILGADGEAVAGSSVEELGAVSTLIAVATVAMRTNSLYGYLSAEAHATEAATALKTAVVRGQKARQNAADALQTARELAAQVEALQIGPYRFGTVARTEFVKATSLITQGDAALLANTLPSFLEAEQHAKRSLVALRSAVESYKTSALQQAETERLALLEQINHLPPPRRDQGSAVKACAVIGAVVAIVPGGYATLVSRGNVSPGDWPEALLRFGLTIVAAGAIGALLGAMFYPSQFSSAADSHHPLDDRKTALDQTIAKLRGFSLENIGAAR